MTGPSNLTGEAMGEGVHDSFSGTAAL